MAFIMVCGLSASNYLVSLSNMFLDCCPSMREFITPPSASAMPVPPPSFISAVALGSSTVNVDFDVTGGSVALQEDEPSLVWEEATTADTDMGGMDQGQPFAFSDLLPNIHPSQDFLHTGGWGAANLTSPTEGDQTRIYVAGQFYPTYPLPEDGDVIAPVGVEPATIERSPSVVPVVRAVDEAFGTY